MRGSVAMSAIICYGNFMAQANSIPKLAGSAGALLAIVGILTFFSAVFSFTPRMFVFTGVALFALSLVAFFVEEFGPRR
jgi:hypothetical protein